VRLAREAERQGMAVNLGWYHELDVARLYSALDNLIINNELRVQMAMYGQKLIDGRGAQRVAAILVDEMKKNK